MVLEAGSGEEAGSGGRVLAAGLSPWGAVRAGDDGDQLNPVALAW